jgi:hypothetical protein
MYPVMRIRVILEPVTLQESARIWVEVLLGFVPETMESVVWVRVSLMHSFIEL